MNDRPIREWSEFQYDGGDPGLPDYSGWVRIEIAATLNDTRPGEWGELGLCPGPYGCPYPTTKEALADGVEEHFCSSCRVIRVYRPRSSGQTR